MAWALVPDLRGRTFGVLTVLGKAYRPNMKSQALDWVCRCECGNHRYVPTYSLLHGTVWHCGCLGGRIRAQTRIDDVTKVQWATLEPVTEKPGYVRIRRRLPRPYRTRKSQSQKLVPSAGQRPALPAQSGREEGGTIGGVMGQTLPTSLPRTGNTVDSANSANNSAIRAYNSVINADSAVAVENTQSALQYPEWNESRSAVAVSANNTLPSFPSATINGDTVGDVEVFLHTAREFIHDLRARARESGMSMEVSLMSMSVGINLSLVPLTGQGVPRPMQREEVGAHG